MESVKTKTARIVPGVRVFSERHKLIKIVKQGDPQYNTINNVAKAGFWFYGTVVSGDKKRGWWNVSYDLFPDGEKSLLVSRRQCTTLRDGEDEPQYNPKHDKINEATERLELLDLEPEEDFDLALPDSDDDGDGGRKDNNALSITTGRRKMKSKKVLSIESFLGMSDESVLQANTFHHFHGEQDSNYIEWTILKEGEEITTDTMVHQLQDCSPFSKKIEWHPQTNCSRSRCAETEEIRWRCV